MKGDMTLDELIAKLCENPEFAEGWAEDQPRLHLEVNVYRLRTAAGLTQQQLADAARMKQPRIAEIERGDGNPTLLTMTRIARALGVTPDRLLLDPKAAKTKEPAAKPSEAAPAPKRPRRRAAA